MLPKPIKAYAVVNIKKPILDALDIFKSKDISIAKGEKIIKVIITPE